MNKLIVLNLILFTILIIFILQNRAMITESNFRKESSLTKEFNLTKESVLTPEEQYLSMFSSKIQQDAIESFEYSLHLAPGALRDPQVGETFNKKMSQFGNKIVYLYIMIPTNIYDDKTQKRDFGRVAFTVMDDVDAKPLYGSGVEYMIYLLPDDPDPFVFVSDDTLVLEGYYKIFYLDGAGRQGISPFYLRPARELLLLENKK